MDRATHGTHKCGCTVSVRLGHTTATQAEAAGAAMHSINATPLSCCLAQGLPRACSVSAVPRCTHMLPPACSCHKEGVRALASHTCLRCHKQMQCTHMALRDVLAQQPQSSCHMACIKPMPIQRTPGTLQQATPRRCIIGAGVLEAAEQHLADVRHGCLPLQHRLAGKRQAAATQHKQLRASMQFEHENTAWCMNSMNSLVQ